MTATIIIVDVIQKYFFKYNNYSVTIVFTQKYYLCSASIRRFKKSTKVMNKNLIIAICSLALFLSIGQAHADEGMWLPSLISERIDDMRAKGFKLDAEDIYSINEASLKDAVLLFGSGCTGEVISPEGLILTNHHCGYSFIQSHSSVEHDYLKDGFWAMTREEELRNPGLTVKFLERMEDVTDIVLKSCKDGISEEEREKLVNKASIKIVKEVEKEGKGIKAKVEGIYLSNKYYLFVYKEYRDIRLVAAPPSSIGKFGGDTDNWMWPRHTGDFSMFRIYTAPDGSPADYSEENIPYKAKKYFKINRKGVQKGDFTMVFGFPGSTMEYTHWQNVYYTQEMGDPLKVDIRTKRLNVINKYMAMTQQLRIMYSAKHARISNGWKKWQGEVQGLKRNHIIEKKQALDQRLEAAAKGTQYEGISEQLGAVYAQYAQARLYRDLYQETAQAFEMASFADNYCKSLRKNGQASGDWFYKNWCAELDKEIFIIVMNELASRMEEADLPAYYLENVGKYGSVEKWADAMFENSVFASKERLQECKLGADELEKDPAYIFNKEFSAWYKSCIEPKFKEFNLAVKPLNRKYMKAQMELITDKAYYPDANLTLRVAYGKVEGYRPCDGVEYVPISTLKGIIEKDNPEIFDYNIPQKLRDIYAAGGHEDQPVCILASNHTTGGNSGSPLIDAEGNLIGINFDRVWEGTMSDIAFDPAFCRNISMDIRYLLFVIKEIGGAEHLLNELQYAE